MVSCRRGRRQRHWCAASSSRVPVLPSAVCALGSPAVRPRGGIMCFTLPSRSVPLCRTGYPADRVFLPLCVTPARVHVVRTVQSPVFPDPLPSYHLSWVCCLVGVPARNRGTGGSATTAPLHTVSFLSGSLESLPDTSAALNVLSVLLGSPKGVGF